MWCTSLQHVGSSLKKRECEIRSGVGKVLSQKEKLKLENERYVGGFQLSEWREKKNRKFFFQISILGFHCVAKNIRA
jgi:ferredoxin-fold anticodon binding domain-containing protein